MADFFSGGGSQSTFGQDQSGTNQAQQSLQQTGGSSQRTSSSITPGAFDSRLNDIYMGGIENLFQGGGIGRFNQSYPNLYSPGSQEQGVLSQLVGLPNQSRYTPEMSQGMGTIQGLLGRTQDTSAQDFVSRLLQNPQAGGMGYLQQLLSQGGSGGGLQSIQDLLGMAMRGPNDLESQGLSTLQSRTDPRMLQDAAERYMREIVSPSATAGLQAGGMGGIKGGALQESLARSGASMALPIAQMIQQARGDYGGAQLGVGSNLAGRQSGLAGMLEQAQMARNAQQGGFAGLLEQMTQGRTAQQGNLANLYEQLRQGQVAERAGLGNQLFGMGGQDSRSSLMNLLTGAQGAAALPRMGQLQDFLRQQQLNQPLFGLRQTPTSTSNLDTSGSTFGNQTGVNSGSSAGRVAGQQGTQQNLTLGNFLGPISGLLAASILNPGGASGTLGSLRSLLGLGASGGGGNFSIPDTNLTSILDSGASGLNSNAALLNPNDFSLFGGGGGSSIDPSMFSLFGGG